MINKLKKEWFKPKKEWGQIKAFLKETYSNRTDVVANAGNGLLPLLDKFPCFESAKVVSEIIFFHFSELCFYMLISLKWSQGPL